MEAKVAKKKYGPVIMIENGHVASCGVFPDWAVNRPKGAYFSFFMGSSWDQWVFVATKDVVRLAGGDCEWNNVFEIVPTLKLMETWGKCEDTTWPNKLILGKEERLWLVACMSACASSLKYQLEKDSETKT